MPRTLGLKKSHRGNVLKKARHRSEEEREEKEKEEIVEAVAKDGPEDLLE